MSDADARRVDRQCDAVGRRVFRPVVAIVSLLAGTGLGFCAGCDTPCQTAEYGSPAAPASALAVHAQPVSARHPSTSDSGPTGGSAKASLQAWHVQAWLLERRGDLPQAPFGPDAEVVEPVAPTFTARGLPPGTWLMRGDARAGLMALAESDPLIRTLCRPTLLVRTGEEGMVEVTDGGEHSATADGEGSVFRFRVSAWPKEGDIVRQWVVEIMDARDSLASGAGDRRVRHRFEAPPHVVAPGVSTATLLSRDPGGAWRMLIVEVSTAGDPAQQDGDERTPTGADRVHHPG